MWNGKALGVFKEVRHVPGAVKYEAHWNGAEMWWRVGISCCIGILIYLTEATDVQCKVICLCHQSLSYGGSGGSGSHKCSHVAHRIFKGSKRAMKVALIFKFFGFLNCRTPSSPFKIICWCHIPSLFFSFGCLKSEDFVKYMTPG